jgi:malonyl CoA-acyl carrier protein transacylase
MAEDGQAAVTRKRLRLQLTVHPLTDQRLNALCDRFATNKGRLVDKLVECLHAAYLARRQYCITGKPCKVDLTDLPDVF